MRKTTDNRTRALGACWAILNRLPLTSPVSADDVWEHLKDTCNVVHGRDLTEKDLVLLEARLRAAQDSQELLQALIDKVLPLAKVKHRAFDVVVKGNETHYIEIVPIPRVDNLQQWAQERANSTGNMVSVRDLNNVVVFRAEPVFSDMFVNPDVDGKIVQIEFFDGYFCLEFNGKDKSYTYDKLNQYQVALCRLFAEHSQFDELHHYLTQVRLQWQAQMTGAI